MLLYWNCQTDSEESRWPQIINGQTTFKSQFPSRILNEGRYRLELIAALYYREWLCEPQKNAPFIEINIQGGLSDSPYWMVKRQGIMAPVIPWERG